MLVPILPMYKIRPSDECAWGQSSVVQPNPGLPNSVNYYFGGTGHDKQNYIPHPAPLPNPTLKCAYGEVLPLLYGDVIWHS